MEVVVQQLSADKKLTLLYATYTCAFFCFPFVICSLVVSGTANAGFNAVLTAILNMCFIAESYYILKNSKTPIAIGFLIGSVCMITLLNFMTAIYWGQLSHCKVYTDDDVVLEQYSCDNKSAYGATSTFATFLFLVQLGYSVGVVLWRGELISEVGLYDEISVPNGSEKPYETIYDTKTSTPSADL